MDWTLLALKQEGFFSRWASEVIHMPCFCYVFQASGESCTHEGLGASMDLSDGWALEEGSWLSHPGAHRFPNTRGGMATFHVADSFGLSHLCPSIILSELHVCPQLLAFQGQLGWRLLNLGLEVQQI